MQNKGKIEELIAYRLHTAILFSILSDRKTEVLTKVIQGSCSIQNQTSIFCRRHVSTNADREIQRVLAAETAGRKGEVLFKNTTEGGCFFNYTGAQILSDGLVISEEKPPFLVGGLIEFRSRFRQKSTDCWKNKDS